MTRATTLDHLSRLDWLETRLKTDTPLIAADLARELGVSLRTIGRDIAILRERGVPVDGERGRGGGLHVTSSWGVGRLHLDFREAVDLLVSLAIAEHARSPLLLADLAPVRRKLVASFAPPMRRRIASLRARLLIAGPASSHVRATFRRPPARLVERLHEAFLLCRPATITYLDGEGRRTQRIIEPHFLLLNAPVWYVLAFDLSRQAIRTLRVDRISAIELMGTTFRPRPYAEFRTALEGADIIFP